MPRLFVAIQLPETAKTSLESIRPIWPGRAEPHAKLHITLRFIGQVSEETADRVASELGGIDFSPRPISLEGVGQFPPRGRARVIWAGVRAPGIADWVAQIGRVCLACGLEPEAKTFHAHVTLLRADERRRVDPALVRGWLEKYQTFRGFAWTASAFDLVESQLDRTGSTYRTRQTFESSRV